MRRKNFYHYGGDIEKNFPDQKQLITYSYNEREQTILGVMQEREGLVYLYEYRGKLIGLEFFISFSRNSISYKLIKVADEA
ncbi:MAG TPA: hypothetical protein VFZ78_08465 [Flavisolibacter sp.]